ncbi:MAG TPA: ATP-binding cassette domain-containing protein [Terriglobales bacterium]|nr:ATP-binding cassette domain-containing protein [Terriglobales bacterium]
MENRTPFPKPPGESPRAGEPGAGEPRVEKPPAGEPLAASPSGDSLVEVRGLVKVYPPATRALDGIDLDIHAGRIFAFLGPNGAGKTTLMRILTTQLRPTAGRASISGCDVVRRGAEVRTFIGYVPQEMSVWTDITGYENLLLYAKIYGLPAATRNAQVREALDSMGLSGFAGTLVKNYSGGMIRRLEVACTLLVKPKIMFLDEPTIGLDPSARRAVWEKILTFKKEFGTTVFFNTHYMDEADLYSDEIAIIDRGRLVKLGTAEELKGSIKRDVIRVGLGPGATAGEKTLARLRALPSVTEVSFADSEIKVAVGDAELALLAVIDVLRAEGLPIVRISAEKPTLDDVFMAYAGSSLQAGPDLREVRSVRRQIQKG